MTETRQIQMKFSGYPTVVTATLSDEASEQYRDRFWEELASPVKMWTWQTTSSGDYFSAKGRPRRHPQVVGNQHIPLEGALRMCDAPAGSIIYSGPEYISVVYSDDVTESLPCAGPVIATADDPAALYEAGLVVRASHFRTHKLVTVELSRKGV